MTMKFTINIISSSQHIFTRVQIKFKF